MDEDGLYPRAKDYLKKKYDTKSCLKIFIPLE